MEDDCALVVVLRSSSIPPASVSWCQRQVSSGFSLYVVAGLLVARRCCCQAYEEVWWKWRVYHPFVYPNKSDCGIVVGVLVVPVRVLRALVRRFRRFGAAPLSSAASSELSLVSLLSAGGRASW
ncbi:unnamed protein product [Brassica rapa subsp. narinosa]